MRTYAWRPKATEGYVTGRLARRVAMSLVAVCLLVLLLTLLFQPFRHPRPHLYVLAAANYRAQGIPPIDYFAEDLAALKAVEPALCRPAGRADAVRVAELTDPDAVEALSDEWNHTSMGSADVLIVYVIAHAVAHEQQVHLVCNSTDPADPQGTLYPLTNLLRRIRDTRAGLRLVLLDVSHLVHDRHWAAMANEVPRLIAQEVHASEDPDLWVITSTSPVEFGHVSRTKNRSVFGYCVTQAMQGEADLNGNHTVDVGELYRYVSVHVAAWAQHYCGAASQTPMLLWGGGPELPRRRRPDLFSVAAFSKSLEPASQDPRQSGEPRLGATEGTAGADVKPSARPVEKEGEPAPHDEPVARAQTVSAGSKPRVEAADGGTDEADAGAAKETETDRTDSGGASQGTPSTSGQKPGHGGDDVDASDDQPDQVNGPTAAPANKDVLPDGDIRPRTADSPAGAPLSIADLLAEGWLWRDRLADPHGEQDRPVDYAPHLWRIVEQRLLAYERLSRAGKGRDRAKLATELQRFVAQLRDLSSGRKPRASSKHDLIAQLARMGRDAVPRIDQPHSLGLAELAASHQGPPLGDELRAAAERLDFFTVGGQRSAFEEWIGMLPSVYDRFVEFRLARTLVARPDLAWPSVRLALKARRLAEQVAAADFENPIWMKPQIEQADRFLLAGERTLRDNIGRESDARAVYLLEKAIEGYRETAETIREVKVARRLHNDLLYRAPDYLHWGFTAGGKSERHAPCQEGLRKLLDELAQLSEVLTHPAPEQLPRLRRLGRRLADTRTEVERSLDDRALQALVRPPIVRGSLWQIECLLATPLPASAARAKLILAAADVERRLAESFDPPSPEAATLPVRRLMNEDWQRLQRQAELELAMAQLGLPESREDGPASSSLRKALLQIPHADGPQYEKAEPAGQTDTSWASYTRLVDLLGEYYRELPTEIEYLAARSLDLRDPQTRADRLGILRSLCRSLYLVRPSKGDSMGQTDPVGMASSAKLHDFLTWQRGRLLAEMDDAPPDELRHLCSAAGAYGRAATSIPHQPPLSSPPPFPVAISGPETLNLIIKPGQEFPLAIENRTAKRTDVWTLLLYDDDVLEVAADADHVAYHEGNLRRLRHAWESRERESPTQGDTAGISAIGDGYPFRPDLSALKPTAVIAPSATETLRLTVRRKRPHGENARLVIKAVTQDAYVRHEIAAQVPALPTVGLLVRGTPNTWTSADDGVVLHPFPNRITEYQLLLADTSGRGKDVDVEILSLERTPPTDLPQAGLSVSEIREILSRYKPESLLSLSGISLPPGGDPVPLPFPEPPEKAPEPPEKDAEPQKSAGGLLLQPTPVSRNLLVVITQQPTQKTILHRLGIVPQRPVRYIRPRVGYDLEKERVEIRVRPVVEAAIPAGGVRVECELVEPLMPDAENRLAGVVESPAFEANLYAEVPSGSDRRMTLHLHVDGFPRAFVYQVPCDTHSTDVPPDTDRIAVRVAGVSAGKAFRAPAGPIPVRLEVDVPPDAFRSQEDLVEVGIDVDRDRELRDEVPVRLRSDRQVNLVLDHVRPGGWLGIETRVDDFRLELAPRGLRNAKANVLARVIVGERESWSAPVELLFDGAAPQLRQVELRPDRVVAAGGELEMSVLATDGVLSGVAKVEAALDQARKGEFAKTPPPVAATPGRDGRWVAKLPTADLPPGRYTLLIRATDKVGNRGDYAKVKVTVITKAEADARIARRTNRVVGTVVYGRLAREPAPGMQVRLVPVDGGNPLVAETDQQGNFTFPKVPPGEYKLTAEGNLRGNKRVGNADVTVASPPGRVEPIEVLVETSR